LHRLALVDTLQTPGAEDKPLLGSTLSADSGAKTRLGFRVELGPSIEFIYWDWRQRDKSQGSGDSVPRETFSPFIDWLRQFRSF
jgi:hypothetical protein